MKDAEFYRHFRKIIYETPPAKEITLARKRLKEVKP